MDYEQAGRGTPKAVSSFVLSSCNLSARLATSIRFAPISANCSAAALHSMRAELRSTEALLVARHQKLLSTHFRIVILREEHEILLIWKAYRPIPELAPTCQAEQETVSDLRDKP